MLSSLPDPFEITGGQNPYYDPAGNIAGLGLYGEDTTWLGDRREGDYDRYLAPAAPFLGNVDPSLMSGMGDYGELLQVNWPTAFGVGAYAYLRSGRNGWAVALGALAAVYAPKLAATAALVDVAFFAPRRVPTFVARH